MTLRPAPSIPDTPDGWTIAPEGAQLGQFSAGPHVLVTVPGFLDQREKVIAAAVLQKFAKISSLSKINWNTAYANEYWNR